MMTVSECLAKADEVDRLGYECPTQDGREAFALLGQGWRRSALFARQQDAWAASHLRA